MKNVFLGRFWGALAGLALCVSAVASTGCSDPNPPGVAAGTLADVTGPPAKDGASGPIDTGGAVSAEVWELFDTPQGADSAGETDGEIGKPCLSNDDCPTGWCVPGKDGYSCTVPCIETCPVGWVCKQIPIPGSDLEFACAQLHLTLCRPCDDASTCVGPEDPLATCHDFGALGHFCATSCGGGGCPEGYSCETDLTSGVDVCLPDSGVCDCDGVAKAQGLETRCSVSNDFGTCFGTRGCGAAGLSACSAATPAAEVCNGQDDDCDGVVDNDLPDLDLDGIADCLDDDQDGDGFLAGVDCDDRDVTVHPGALESCNGKDDDCNGTTDDFGTPGCVTYYLDQDGDTYGVETGSVCACGPTDSYTAPVAGDCNDQLATVHPGAKEVCDGLDNDCDGKGDTPGLEGCVPWYVDADSDGHGHPSKWKCLCGPMDEYLTALGDDCDDTSSLTWPGAPEVCDHKDNDCDGRIDIAAVASPECPADCGSDLACVDKCAITVDCSTDCGPGTAACVMGALSGCTAPATVTCLDPQQGCASFETCGACPPMPAEVCNGQDDDCDGGIDEGVKVTLYIDKDGDGYGKAGTAFDGCPGAPLTAETDDDCADDSDTIHPNAEEVCDGVDQDCDGETDEGALLTFWVDQDNDQYGDPAQPVSACEAPAGAVVVSGDCAPEDATVYPGAPERCNGQDDSCDGLVDEDWPDLGTSCDGADADPCPDGTVVCTASQDGTMCADAEDPLIERCNGVDDDCNGQTDELWPSLGEPCDGDDVDACAEGAVACDAAGTGIVCAELGDGHVEACNGQDDDCDGQTDEEWPALGSACDGPDADQCATGTTVCAGSGAATVCEETGPSKVEACNGQDDDCDGQTDEGWPSLGEACDGPDADQCALGAFVCAPDGAGVVCVESGVAQAEVCNDQDDDCDGLTDEDFVAKGQPCDGPDADTCADGKQVCNGTVLVCDDDAASKSELCNGQDDTCDGVVDEGFEQKGLPCDGPDGDQCEEGTWTCDGVGLVCSDTTGTQTESCNGQDDDCDGAIDEGNPGGGGVCNVPGAKGVCQKGVWQCQGGQLVCQQTQFGSQETCNGQDDDCDGQVDGMTENCSNACGSGSRTCYSGSWGSCSAPTPQCTSGACCDGCHYRSSSYQCGGPDQTVTECQGSCGGQVIQKTKYRYCTGYSDTCGTGNTKWESQTVDYCSSGQLCKQSGSSASCSSCACGCSGGQCTVNNQYAKTCSGGDVWWTGCDGAKTSKVEDCGACSCQNKACKVTQTTQTVCSGNNVYWKDCKGNAAGFKESCCGGCANGKCKTSPSLTIDQGSSYFSKHGGTQWWSAHTHPDNSWDGMFNTKAWGSDKKFVYTFGGYSGNYWGTFRSGTKLYGTFKIYVYQPDPDPFDPTPNTSAAPSSYYKCSSVHFTISGATNSKTVTKSMTGSGWRYLGTFDFCGQEGYVEYDDSATPKNCAVSFDAVKWEAQ